MPPRIRPTIQLYKDPKMINIMVEWIGKNDIASRDNLFLKHLEKIGNGDRKYMKRFMDKIEENLLSGCWEWQSNRDMQGYGRFCFNGEKWRAHRMSYKIFKGELIEGLVIDHLCRNKRCVNPDHLEQVTNKENILRGESPMAKLARRTHCSKGHLLTQRSGNRRHCKICNKNYPTHKQKI